MATIYTVCAVVGGVILLCQLLLTVIGLDHDHADIAEVGDDIEIGDEYADAHDSTWFFSVLTFKSLVAALAFFGLGGHAALSAGISPFISVQCALAAAILAMLCVAWLMRVLYRLDAQGNVRIEHCIGETGTVYLGIPANQSGAGKVTVSVQNRSMEYAAMTENEAIATGARVEVVGVKDSETLLVKQDTSST